MGKSNSQNNIEMSHLMGIGVPCDFGNKELGIRQYVRYMLARTQQMFKYDGLPDTLPQREIELQLQCNGFSCITKVNGNLYAFYGGLGGVLNEYYLPTLITIANPYLKYNAQLKVGEECVIAYNDSLHIGLMPLFNRYATMLAENDVTIRLADINARIVNIISASDDSTNESAKKYLEDIEKGKLGIIAENSFLSGVKSQPCASSGGGNNITQLIELQHYLKGSWYEEIGLQASFNMKREALNSSETSQDDDILLPLADDMLKQRQIACDKINKMYGTNISVDFASAWKNNHIEEEMANELVEEENPANKIGVEDSQGESKNKESKEETA